MKNLLLLSLLAFSLTAFSQGSIGNLSYTTGAPVGSFSDYVSDYSWKGIEFGYEFKWGENLTYGFRYRYLNFYEKKDRGTYEFENGAITTTRYTYSFVNNFDFTLNYYLHNDSRFTPFAGLAIGPAFVRNKLIIGIFNLEDNTTKLSLSPQIGTLVEIVEGTELNIKVNYNYIPMSYENFKSVSFIGVSVGLSWSSLYN
jgi:hypothetical protein